MRLSISILAAALLSGCGSQDSPRPLGEPDLLPEAVRYGGTAVAALAIDPQSLNILAAPHEALGLHAALLSLRLVSYDEDLEPVPLLAERWDTVRVAPDTLELTFRLRRDVRWHDGVPSTAEDVAFTYDRLRNPRVGFAYGAPLAFWSPVAEVVDSFTIRFRLRAHSQFLSFWATTALLPAHILRDVPPEQLRNHPFGTRPLGNGPFQFVRYVPNQEWVFEANPDFPEGLGGRPYLDRLVVRIVPDENTRFVELMRGALDLAKIRPAQADQAQARPDVRVATGKTTTWAYIVWNNRLPIFHDARVRRALTMAIDREGLVDAFLGGYGEVGRFTATPAHWQYDPEDTGTLLPYDPEAADRLLDEAGWRLHDASGVRKNEQGQPLRFTLMAAHAVQTYTDVLPAVQAQLRQVGADVRAELMEQYTMLDRMDAREYDAILHQWDDWIRLDNTYILHSRNRDAQMGVTGYSHPRADRYMDTLAVTMDRDAARPLWREYQRFMVQESPLTVLFYPYNLFAVRTRLQGVEVRPGESALASAPRWWILPDGRRPATRDGKP